MLFKIIPDYVLTPKHIDVHTPECCGYADGKSNRRTRREQERKFASEKCNALLKGSPMKLRDEP